MWAGTPGFPTLKQLLRTRFEKHDTERGSRALRLLTEGLNPASMTYGLRDHWQVTELLLRVSSPFSKNGISTTYLLCTELLLVNEKA